MKIPFDIKFRPQIESGEYTVVTESGYPVKIYRWDYKDKEGTPILGSYVQEGYEYAAGWYIDGKFNAKPSNLDLVLVANEPLTPLAQALSDYLKNDFEFFATKKWDEKKWNEVMNAQAAELLELAKKELCNGCSKCLDEYWLCPHKQITATIFKAEDIQKYVDATVGSKNTSATDRKKHPNSFVE